MPLKVKPYEVSFVFFDSSNTKIYEASHKIDGDRDLPCFTRDTTCELHDLGTNKYLGTISDTHIFVTTDNNNLTYKVTVVCKNSHTV